MRLTNTLRDAFIRAAMNDVPSVDYYEQIRVLVQKDAVDQLPPKIRAIYKDKDMQHFISHGCRYHGGQHVSIPNAAEYKPSTTTADQLSTWEAEADAQRSRNAELRAKLHNIAYGCKTRKELATMLPEFEKYLPADEIAACRTLPALANVVSDFMKAGWPKGTPKPEAEKVTKRTAKK